jgi:hypothetical protein
MPPKKGGLHDVVRVEVHRAGLFAGIEDLVRLLRRQTYAGVADGNQKLPVFRPRDLRTSSRAPSTAFIGSIPLTMRFVAVVRVCTSFSGIPESPVAFLTPQSFPKKECTL